MLLRYVGKPTLIPARTTAGDAEAVLAAGWEERLSDLQKTFKNRAWLFHVAPADWAGMASITVVGGRRAQEVPWPPLGRVPDPDSPPGEAMLARFRSTQV